MDALWSIKAEIGARQQCVLDALREMGSANNRMISARTGMPINSVTPRMNELRKLGLVELDREDRDKVTNRSTYYWRARPV